MESTVFSAFTHHANIRAAIVNVTIVNRLEGDQVKWKHFFFLILCMCNKHNHFYDLPNLKLLEDNPLVVHFLCNMIIMRHSLGYFHLKLYQRFKFSLLKRLVVVTHQWVECRTSQLKINGFSKFGFEDLFIFWFLYSETMQNNLFIRRCNNIILNITNDIWITNILILNIFCTLQIVMSIYV